MFEWLIKRNKKAEKLSPQMESAVIDFSKKYIEDFMGQFQTVNVADVVALPSILGGKKLGAKELPLAVIIQEAYLRNPTVFACVNDISKAVAMAPFALHETDDFGQYTTIFNHPLLDLLENPNQTQTRSEFVKTLMLFLLLSGNALVWKNFDKGKRRNKQGSPGKGVSELIILNPDMVDYEDNGFEITKYIGKKKTPLEGNTWEPEEIIHFRLVNPCNQFWGISPVQAAYRSVDIDSKILDWWMNSLENGCKKDAILKFGHELTAAQFQRVRQLIDQQLAGFQNGRGWMILGHEMEIEFLNMTPAELDFMKSREMSSKEIMKIFSVPPPILGDMEQSTFNNMEEATKTFWLSTVCSHLNDICAVLTKRLLPDFGLDINKFYVGYDTQAIEPLRKLYYDAIDYAVKLIGISVPLNDVNKKLNLQFKEYEGGDIGYMSHNLVPLGFYDNPKDLANEDNGSTKK